MSFIKFVRIFLLILIIIGLGLIVTERMWVPQLADAIILTEGEGQSPPKADANIVGPGKPCGGFIMHAGVCQQGYICDPGPNPIPDKGGICTKYGFWMKFKEFINNFHEEFSYN